jgi:hypothetical protein
MIITAIIGVTVMTAGAQSVTNLENALPYIERFARDLDVDMPLPLTTNRVSRHIQAHRIHTMGVWIDGRFSFSLDTTNGFVNTFSDNKNSLGSLTQRLQPPEIQKAMSTPPTISEKEALDTARKYLARLGYDERHLAVGPPQIRQEKPFHWFTVEWTWTHDPVEWVLKEKPRPLFTVEIDGLRGKVTHFWTLMGWKAADSLSNFPYADSLTNFPSAR